MIDPAQYKNHVEQFLDETRIFCAACGDPEGKTHVYWLDEKGVRKGRIDDPGYAAQPDEVAIPTGPTGFATPEQLESHADGWHDVDGHLCCSVYCAAIAEHGDEEKAQEARAKKALANAEEVAPSLL